MKAGTAASFSHRMYAILPAAAASNHPGTPDGVEVAAEAEVLSSAIAQSAISFGASA